MSFAARCGESCETPSCWGQIIAILDLERGIPSKRESAARVDYVPALCTHRPSLLPIARFNKAFGLEPPRRATAGADSEKFVALCPVEEVKVVTRFP